MGNLKKTSPSWKKIRIMGKQINIPGSGATSLRSLGITLFIVSQSSHWWLRKEPLNQMQVPSLSQN
jgi:hypothetical protein